MIGNQRSTHGPCPPVCLAADGPDEGHCTMVDDDHGSRVTGLDVEGELVAGTNVLAIAVDVGGADVDRSLDVRGQLRRSIVAVDDDVAIVAGGRGTDRDR